MFNIEKYGHSIIIARRNGKSFAAIGRGHGISPPAAKNAYKRALRRMSEPERIEAELNTRTINALKWELGSYVNPDDQDELRYQPYEGVLTPELIASRRFSMGQLKRIPNIGVKCINELQEWLVRHGREPVV